MLNHQEARRFDIQLLADVLADLYQGAVALAAGAGFRFVAHFDAFQMPRQRLATGASARVARRGYDRSGLDFGLNRRQILIDIVFEQLGLFFG